jgi:hypothetical protein
MEVPTNNVSEDDVVPAREGSSAPQEKRRKTLSQRKQSVQTLGAVLPPQAGTWMHPQGGPWMALRVGSGCLFKGGHGSRRKEGVGMCDVFPVHATSTTARPSIDPGECGTGSMPKEAQGSRCGCKREAFRRQKTKPSAHEGGR